MTEQATEVKRRYGKPKLDIVEKFKPGPNKSGLSPDHYAVLIAAAQPGSTYEGIAAELKIKIGTVKSRVNRAREKLEQLMGDGDGT